MKRSEKYLEEKIPDRNHVHLELIKRYGKYCSLEAQKEFTSSKFQFKLAEKQLDKMAKEDNF